MISLSWYLLVAALLFFIGLYGVFARRNAVAILMGVELMLNAVNINLVAFWRYRTVVNPLAPPPSGWAWAIFVLAVAAAEAAVGLALIISVYRRRDATVAEDLDLLQH
jgi:NADH-quinone oxidoreductase subunit K